MLNSVSSEAEHSKFNVLASVRPPFCFFCVHVNAYCEDVDFGVFGTEQLQIERPRAMQQQFLFFCVHVQVCCEDVEFGVFGIEELQIQGSRARAPAVSALLCARARVL